MNLSNIIKKFELYEIFIYNIQNFYKINNKYTLREKLLRNFHYCNSLNLKYITSSTKCNTLD